MHQAIPAQGYWLRQVVNGLFGHHAVPTNGAALSAFRYHVMDLWRRTLRRRSQKDEFTWPRIAKLADHWLPKPLIRHPWPRDRFAALPSNIPKVGAVYLNRARTVLCGGVR